MKHFEGLRRVTLSSRFTDYALDCWDLNVPMPIVVSESKRTMTLDLNPAQFHELLEQAKIHAGLRHYDEYRDQKSFIDTCIRVVSKLEQVTR